MRKTVTTDQTLQTVTVRVPLRFRARGGRKVYVMPAGAYHLVGRERPHIDGALVKALVRGWRWSRLLETAQFISITALAKAEKVDKSYLCKLLRLSLLAPDIVEMILDDSQSSETELGDLHLPLPLDWEAQRKTLLISSTVLLST